MLDECIQPENALEAVAHSPHAQTIAHVYAAYRKSLIALNQLDFPSLLAIAVDLLEKKPAISKQISRIYTHVCVDEFQDTNTAQSRLLYHLVKNDNPNLFIVADDDQLIYRWNGASTKRISEIRERLSMNVIQLPENYRCPHDVITLANNLIRHNTDRTADKKPLVAHKSSTDKKIVTLHANTDFPEEARWVVGAIAALPEVDRGRCVVLARRRKLLDEIVVEFNRSSIPAHIPVKKNEYQSAPYRWLHSLLRLVNARQDKEQLRRISNAFYLLEGANVAIEDVIANAAVVSIDLIQSWFDMILAREGISEKTTVFLSFARNALLERMDYWAVIDKAQEWFKILAGDESITSGQAFDAFEDERAIWRSIVDEIATHYDLKGLTLNNFLQEMDLRAKEKPIADNAVRCFTIHAAKGMEFKHVFVIGMVEDELPSWAAVKQGANPLDLMEERRNCFVAITRAEETLTLTYASRYAGRNKQPSRFLSEMGLLDQQ